MLSHHMAADLATQRANGLFAQAAAHRLAQQAREAHALPAGTPKATRLGRIRPLTWIRRLMAAPAS